MAVQGVAGIGVPQGAESEYKARLIRGAHEFEGQMLKELLKPLAAGSDWTGDGNEDSSTGILGEFAFEALGKGLSEQGGFGIADRILGQFSRFGNQPGTDGVTGNRHFDTTMRTR
jgi:Rod binding domain-containing protein